MTLTADLRPEFLRAANWFTSKDGVFSYLHLKPHRTGKGVEIYACDGDQPGSAGIGLLDEEGSVSHECAIWLRHAYIEKAIDKARIHKLAKPKETPLRIIIDGGRAYLNHIKSLEDCYGFLREPYPAYALAVPSKPRAVFSVNCPSVSVQKKIADTTFFLARIAGCTPEEAETARATCAHHDGGDDVYRFGFMPPNAAFVFVRGQEVRPARPQIKLVEAAA